jgi:phage regulator Rha-like protein
MNPLSLPVQTMTSRDLADLVELRHDNVRRTIETLATKGVIALPQSEEVPNVGPGPKTVSVYRVGKRDSYVIVAQLSPEFTARLVDRWQELESRAAPVPALNMRDPKQVIAAALQLIEVNGELQAKVETLAVKVEAMLAAGAEYSVSRLALRASAAHSSLS